VVLKPGDTLEVELLFGTACAIQIEGSDA
jgi:hypothetical protein